MIKAAGKTGLGLPLLMLGLSGENVTRLAAGEPIRIQGADMAAFGFPPMEIVIHYGRTEQEIVDDLKAHGIKMHEAGNLARCAVTYSTRSATRGACTRGL